MKTKETTVYVGGYKVMFSVFDDREWMVTIQNDDFEFGASSMPCTGNWNKGLANAFMNVIQMMDIQHAEVLLLKLKQNKNIDNHFIEYLPDEWRIDKKDLESFWDDKEAFEAAYDEWEKMWINGPQF